MKLKYQTRYILGTLAVVTAQCLALGLLGAPALYALAIAVVAAGGGSVVLFAYWLRGWIEDQRKKAKAQGAAAGPLTQQWINEIERDNAASDRTN